MAEKPNSASDVIAICEERDVRFVRLWFTDVLGQLKSFSINASELEDAFEGGMGFDGSSITGFNPIEESDMIAMPDPIDLRDPSVAPRGRQRHRAHVLRHPRPGRRALRGRPPLDPQAGAQARRRPRLRRLQRRPRARVLLLPVGQPEASPEVLDEGGYFDLTTLDAGSDVRRETVLALEKMGIHVEYTHHEVGPSQHEIDMRYKTRSQMADDCMTYRIVGQGVRDEVRLARDLHAQAPVRRERLRHARAPVARQGRQQRLLRRRRPVLPLADWRSRSSPAS